MVDYKSRILLLRQKMKEKQLSAILVTKPENKLYLSGFRSSNNVLLLTEEENILITDFRYIEAAEALVPLYRLMMTDREHKIADRVRELGHQRIGIEEEHMTVAFCNEIKEAAADGLFRADGLIESIRVRKEEEEQNLIQKAEALCDECFNHMLGTLRPGMTERQAAKEIELFFSKNGADRLAFDTICVSGERTSLPHGEPSNKSMERGEFVTMDFGCVIDGYCSDMTRTIVLGKADAQQKEVYSIVLAAQNAACDAIRAGISCREADLAARSVIELAGYGDRFGHGTGHGVGLEVHEAPTSNPGSDETFASGMVTSIEPGIYLPKKYGVRIEDLAIVTDSGIINLTKSNKELIEL